MNFRWFISRAAREEARTRKHAKHMRKHCRGLLNAQRDILSVEAVQKVDQAIEDLHAATRSSVGTDVLQSRMKAVESSATKWIKPYPNAALRENVEVFLVAIAVAVGIHTFIAKPFKIPTGSMQPTLYGVTSEPDFQRSGFPSDLRPDPDFEIPNRLKRFFRFWVSGVSYNHVVARSEGAMEPSDDKPKKFLLFNLYQDFRVGGENYRVWWPPDNLLKRAGLIDGAGRANARVFKKGEDIVKMKSVSGDYLFVDRITYNFRKPKRGEIIVFQTSDIPLMEQNPLLQDQVGQFYIKRLVVLGGEKVRIDDDRHLVINGTTRLDSSTPRFEKVYSFDPSVPARDSQYSGHLNNRTRPGLAPLFPSEDVQREVPPGHFMVMGDNTVNSSDSRTWGWFPQRNVIGRSGFVCWPFGWQEGRASRFGWRSR